MDRKDVLYISVLLMVISIFTYLNFETRCKCSIQKEQPEQSISEILPKMDE